MVGFDNERVNCMSRYYQLCAIEHGSLQSSTIYELYSYSKVGQISSPLQDVADHSFRSHEWAMCYSDISLSEENIAEITDILYLYTRVKHAILRLLDYRSLFGHRVR